VLDIRSPSWGNNFKTIADLSNSATDIAQSLCDFFKRIINTNQCSCEVGWQPDWLVRLITPEIGAQRISLTASMHFEQLNHAGCEQTSATE
jgi:hypothetical protein